MAMTATRTSGLLELELCMLEVYHGCAYLKLADGSAEEVADEVGNYHGQGAAYDEAIWEGLPAIQLRHSGILADHNLLYTRDI